MFGLDYCDKFNPQDYLQKNYSVANLGPLHLLKLNALHQFYQSYSPTAKLRILDLGSGPSIANTISAAPYAAEIVLSEYTEANRSALLQWLNNDPNAFDWTHVFKHVVVDLEGKTEEEVPIRAEMLRKVIKAVVPCDVNKNPPIPMQYVDQYDIVTDFLCLVRPSHLHEYKLASFPGLPRFSFAFKITHGNGRSVKYREDWEHSSREWMQGGHGGGGSIFKYLHAKLESEFLTGQDEWFQSR